MATTSQKLLTLTQLFMSDFFSTAVTLSIFVKDLTKQRLKIKQTRYLRQC